MELRTLALGITNIKKKNRNKQSYETVYGNNANVLERIIAGIRILYIVRLSGFYLYVYKNNECSINVSLISDS